MKHTIEVENIRCGGCASTITKRLLENSSIQSVNVLIDDQIVEIESDDENGKQAAITILESLGYPEKGTAEGLDALKGKAKSVVSCAIGKMSQ